MAESERRPDEPAGGGRKAQATPLSLLERARANEPQAWSRLVGLYAPLVRFWCRRHGVPDQDAEDVAQEVFAAVQAGLARFRRDRPGDTFRGWLRAVTHNHVLRYFRRNRGRPRGEGGSAALAALDQIPDPAANDEEAEVEEVGRLYRRALEQVRGEFEEKTWRAFWRSAVDGRAPADLEGELGMTAAAVRQAKSRVLRRLKQEVGDLLE